MFKLIIIQFIQFMVFWNTSSFNRYFKVDKIKQVHWALTYSVL